MLLTCFEQVPDVRRREGRKFTLPHILLFTVLAIASGADSYRSVHTWIAANLDTLKRTFALRWKAAPAYSTIRFVLQGVSARDLEQALRAHARQIAALGARTGLTFVGLDGKTVRGSFDRFHDQEAIQVFSAFLTQEQIILAHEEIEDKKTNEIPIAQQLIPALRLQGVVFTLDALHGQKKLSRQPKQRGAT
jgi:hypothetical protein